MAVQSADSARAGVVEPQPLRVSLSRNIEQAQVLTTPKSGFFCFDVGFTPVTFRVTDETENQVQQIVVAAAIDPLSQAPNRAANAGATRSTPASRLPGDHVRLWRRATTSTSFFW